MVPAEQRWNSSAWASVSRQRWRGRRRACGPSHLGKVQLGLLTQVHGAEFNFCTLAIRDDVELGLGCVGHGVGHKGEHAPHERHRR